MFLGAKNFTLIDTMQDSSKSFLIRDLLSDLIDTSQQNEGKFMTKFQCKKASFHSFVTIFCIQIEHQELNASIRCTRNSRIKII